MSIFSFIGHTLTESFGKKLTIDDKYINNEFDLSYINIKQCL